jgi:hypothetical protein
LSRPLHSFSALLSALVGSGRGIALSSSPMWYSRKYEAA